MGPTYGCRALVLIEDHTLKSQVANATLKNLKFNSCLHFRHHPNYPKDPNLEK